MGVAERRQRHRASLRREILDAASRLFVEEGYDRVTMRRIAERIEYSPTTIYLYFTDKQELFEAVGEETFSLLTEELDRVDRAPLPPMARLREGLRTYVDFGLAHPDHYSVTFLRPGHRGVGSETRPRVFDTFRRAVAACVDAGEIRTPSVEMSAQALWAAVHGLTMLFITATGFPVSERTTLMNHQIDVLLGGLQAPAPVRRAPVKSKPATFFD